MLDIPSRVRVHVETLLAAQNDMGVCDAIEQYAPVGKPDAMNAPHLPKVAGIDSTVPAPAHTVAPAPPAPAPVLRRRTAPGAPGRAAPGPARRLGLRPHHAARTHRAPGPHAHAWTTPCRSCCAPEPPWWAPGAVSSSWNPPTASAPTPPSASASPAPTSVTSRPCRAAPRRTAGSWTDRPAPTARPSRPARPARRGRARPPPPRGRRPARLRRRATRCPWPPQAAGRLGAAVWLYDEPAEPVERQRHLVGLYARYATEHLARLLELERTRAAMRRPSPRSCCPPRLPRVAGVQLAARHRTGPRGGGDWYDALPLPDAALGLAVGSRHRLRAQRGRRDGPAAGLPAGVRRDGGRGPGRRPVRPGAAAAADRARPLAPPPSSRYCEPALRKITLAGAGHSPPLMIGERRTEFVETSLSAPLGMLACWEAPSVESAPEPGETVLLYTRRPAAPHRRPHGPRLRPAARGGGGRARRRCATTPVRSPTTSCAPCCRTGSTRADSDGGRRAAGGALRVSGDRRAAYDRPGRRSDPGNRSSGPGPPSVRPYDGGGPRAQAHPGRSRAVSRRRRVGGAHGAAENPETARPSDEEPIKQRKNGLYPGVSDELAENMKSGWADTELHGLEPIAQAADTAARRAALSARFPGERLVIPAGNLKTRSNDTEYPFRASVEYAYLTGNQTEDGVLVLEPTDGRRTRRRSTCCRAPTARTASSGWPARASCGSAAATPSPRPSSCTASPPPTCASSPDALARGHRPGPRRARLRRRHRGRPDRQGHRRARRGAARLPLRGAAGQGRLRDRRAAEGRRLHGRAASRTS